MSYSSEIIRFIIYFDLSFCSSISEWICCYFVYFKKFEDSTTQNKLFSLQITMALMATSRWIAGVNLCNQQIATICHWAQTSLRLHVMEQPTMLLKPKEIISKT